MDNKNSTPLSMDKLKKNAVSVESATHSDSFPNVFNKYNIILAISVLALVAGASFWIFVTYML